MKKQLLTLLGTFLFTLFSFSQDSIWIENFNYPDGTTESTTGTTPGPRMIVIFKLKAIC